MNYDCIYKYTANYQITEENLQPSSSGTSVTASENKAFSERVGSIVFTQTESNKIISINIKQDAAIFGKFKIYKSNKNLLKGDIEYIGEFDKEIDLGNLDVGNLGGYIFIEIESNANILSVYSVETNNYFNGWGINYNTDIGRFSYGYDEDFANPDIIVEGWIKNYPIEDNILSTVTDTPPIPTDINRPYRLGFIFNYTEHEIHEEVIIKAKVGNQYVAQTSFNVKGYWVFEDI